MVARHRKQGRFVEQLELRQFLSATQLDFSNFASTNGLVTNGYGSSATTSNNALLLTDGIGYESRSALTSNRVAIDTFTAHFTFQLNASPSSGDGFSFVIDNGSNTDQGGNGEDLGYAGGSFGANSVALGFNIYNQNSFGTTFGFSSAGSTPNNPVNASPVDFHTSDTFNATVTYDGTNLSVTVVDANTQATFTDSEAINLVQALGSHTAYIGFTGATGLAPSTQQIDEFDFASTDYPPTITVPAAASGPITGKTASLSVSAASNSTGTLSYLWSVLHKPSGAKGPTFSDNNSTSANGPTAKFSKAGTYILRAAVTDSNGGTSVSDVELIVQQTATELKLTPHKALIGAGKKKDYRATIMDQFAHPMRSQPAITYIVATGGGSIAPTTGVYTAGSEAGHLLIDASGDGFSGTSGATIVT
jgi:hypothetical protein